ncbi:NUMOD1 domain-containing DNA-binding protein [Pedobacter sp. PWIIR3]
MEKKYTLKISRYSLSGALLETYPNARVAAEALNTSQQYLTAAANPDKNPHTAKGYIWRRGNQPQLDMVPFEKTKWHLRCPLAKDRKTVGQYDLDGNLVASYLNTKEAGKAVGVHYQGIRKVTNGRGLTYGGFIWSKTVKKKISVDPRIKLIKSGISQYDLNGRWIQSYKTGLQAQKVTGIGHDSISLAIKGETTITAGGFLWRKGQNLRINISELRSNPLFPRSRLATHIKTKRKNNLSKKSGEEI